MKLLVTGSSGHLGDALMRVLAETEHEAVGLDLLPGPFTDYQGSICDRALLAEIVPGCDAILHAATLHKPHVATHPNAAFVSVNVSGTLALLEAAVAAGVGRFLYTSTTSAFGAALVPPPGAPAAWIDESVLAVPKNIYGATKTAAEELCHLFHRQHGLAALVLRTARFFPEEDDLPEMAAAYSDENLKANEFLYRRADIEDVVTAHLAALEKAPEIGFGRFIVSAPTPFRRDQLAALRQDLPAVVAGLFPGQAAVYEQRGYRMLPKLDRVYDSAEAQRALGWRPRWDFARILEQLAAEAPIGSDLARRVGSKGYHRCP